MVSIHKDDALCLYPIGLILGASIGISISHLYTNPTLTTLELDIMFFLGITSTLAFLLLIIAATATIRTS